MAKHGGRKRNGRNTGFWFRSGRGWYVTEGLTSIRLLDSNGNPLRDEGAAEEAKLAYARYLVGRQDQPTKQEKGVTVAEVCEAYLRYVEREGRASTLRLRTGLLFDLCRGFAKGKESKGKLHRGYGSLAARDLTPQAVSDWIAAHPRWNGRVAIQAIKRALNYAVKEMKVLSESPLKGMKAPRTKQRVTYVTELQEQAIYKHCKPALAWAVRTCIATGARPICEFASLTAAHVQEIPNDGETLPGQIWVFSPEEAKTKKERVIYVPEDIAAEVRKLTKRHHTGPLFRNSSGNPWTGEGLRVAFRRMKARLAKHGVNLGAECCPYSLRHTYAKRKLGGYGGKKPVTIEVLAGLMGNSRDVCWDHYARWCNKYTNPLREAVS